MLGLNSCSLKFKLISDLVSDIPVLQVTELRFQEVQCLRTPPLQKAWQDEIVDLSTLTTIR